MRTEQQAKGLYIVAAAIAVVGLLLGVVTLVMGHTVEGALTIIGFLLAAAFLTTLTRWAKRTDQARANHGNGGEP